MKKIICLSASLVCMLSAFVGCGSKNDDFIGKWECSEIVTDGQSSNNMLGAPVRTLFQVEIDKDNKGKFYSSLVNGLMRIDEPIDITWKKKNKNSIEFTIIPPKGFEESATAESYTLIKDGEIVLIDISEGPSDSKAYFTKVDEFTPIPDDTERSFSSSMDTSIDAAS
ncbi:hypothetical protein [Ruminococcus flavefaciens]|uniref:hypothetical protein n=1 Tax=Ruminococcus flavefaciens TaxID=1265 RepID=UPI0026F2AE3C|nr:hypothetical protein [Ruminococcus flavefaciens]